MRNALRNRYRLFQIFKQANYTFESGKINNSAKYANFMPDVGNQVQRLYDADAPITEHRPVRAENDSIMYEPSLFTADLLEFECPLSYAQYNTLKTNPYGIISVNGMQGWLRELEYDYSEGTAKFKLKMKRGV
jgi:hypothetical protein